MIEFVQMTLILDKFLFFYISGEIKNYVIHNKMNKNEKCIHMKFLLFFLLY